MSVGEAVGGACGVPFGALGLLHQDDVAGLDFLRLGHLGHLAFECLCSSLLSFEQLGLCSCRFGVRSAVDALGLSGLALRIFKFQRRKSEVGLADVGLDDASLDGSDSDSCLVGEHTEATDRLDARTG